MFFACCLAVALSAAIPTLHASTSKQPPHVVILNSYHYGEEWTDKELAGILPVLRSSYPDLTPSVEHLDFKRNPGRTHLNHVKRFLKAKYRDKPVDLLMALDNRALSLVLDVGDDMFPKAPLVFAGVNGFTPEMIQKRPMTTGVAEMQDIAGTLEMALKLLPETKQVLAIHDYTSSGLAVRQEAETALSAFSDRVRIDYSPGVSMAELRQLLAEQPPDTIALLLTFVTDSEGRTFSRDESTRRISTAASVPVFAMHETRLGDGILGGMLLFGEEHGKQAAEIALRIFNGENPGDIPVAHSRSVPMVDFGQLQRFRIPESILPAGTIVINKPTSILSQYKLEIGIIAVVVVVQLLLIVILFVFYRRTKQAQIKLRKAEREYRDLFENAPVGIFKSNLQGRYLSVNPVGAAMFGYDSPQDMIETVTDIGSQVYADIKDRQAIFEMLRSQGKAANYECGMKCKDGTVVPVSFNGSASFDDSRDIEYIDGFITDITERKHAKEALAKREHEYRNLFENAPVGIFKTNRDGLFLSVNPQGAAMFGFDSPQDMIENVTDIGNQLYANPSDRPVEMELLCSQGEVVDRFCGMKCKDGTAIQTSYSARVSYDNFGNIEYVDGFITDITERKQTEQTLNLILEGTAPVVGQDFFRALVSLLARGLNMRYALVGELTEDRERVRTLAVWADGKPGGSKEYALHGTPCATTSMTVDECHFPEKVTEHFPEDSMLLEMGAESYLGVALRDSHGKMIGILALIHDEPSHDLAQQAKAILKTFGARAGAELERIHAERALLASEQRYQTVFDSVGDIIQLYDLEGRILDTNQAACDRLGYSHAELTEMNLRDIDGPESAAGVGERLTRIEEEGHLSFEVEHIKRDGSSIFTEMNSRLMAFKGRDVVFSVGRDITGRKQMEEAMVKAKEAAETANKAKSEFLANMSHEIRTPLNGVLGMLQLLQTMPLGKEEQEYIDLALISGKGLLTVINDILSFSKIEAGMLEIKNKPFDIAFTIHSVMEIFRRDAKIKGLSFRCKVDSDMPPSLLGDEGRLREILFNLAGNALKFTESGEVAITAKLASRDGSPDPRVVLAISDTGIGIPEDKLEGLFQPFTQVDGSHTRKYGGTGLGLSIVRRLVGLMGGELDILSKVGLGTTVTIQLTFGLPDQGQMPSVPTHSSHPGHSAERPFLRILVAEDDPTNRLLTVKLLETLGHTVVAMENGKKALAILRTAPFDAVFMDIQMPVMDGVETTKRIRNDTSGDFPPSLPIIALTAHAMEGDKENFLNAGMNDYLAKPLIKDDLVTILEKLRLTPGPAKGF